jgi:hypothetical protein
MAQLNVADPIRLHQALDGIGVDLCEPEVSDFPRFDFSMKDVKRAAGVIAGALPWTEETAPQIQEAFRIANSWRDAHAFPMRSIRASIIWYLRDREMQGLTAARLKRMQAIRRKLRRISLGLNQLQDLGGCRAILPSLRMSAR